MRAAVDMAGYTLSESDELRKAIAKKQKEKLEKHRLKFIKGASERGLKKETAEAIFADWEEFARYGFNKSHAANYGIVSVQTAYLKTHYPVEYMTALLSASKNDSEKVAFYAADCRSMGIEVLPPDVNHSGYDFTIEDRPNKTSAIRFGMGAVKNVGQGPVDFLIEARQNKPFSDLNDFARRVDLQKVGKRAMESLIRVGALDSFGPRKALLEAIDQIISVSTSHFRALNSGQLSFFGTIEGVEEDISLPNTPLLDRREQLEWERELIGLYVSDHPLTPYLPTLQRKVTHFSGQLGETNHGDKVIVAGLVARFRNHQTKKGDPMGFVTLEDVQGQIDLVCFPRTWDKYATLVVPDRVLLAEGKVDSANGGDPKVLVDKLIEVLIEVDQDGSEIDPYLSYLPGEENSGPYEMLADPPAAAPEKKAPPLAIREGAPRDIQPQPADNPMDDDWDSMPPPPEPMDWYMAAAPLESAPAQPAAVKISPTQAPSPKEKPVEPAIIEAARPAPSIDVPPVFTGPALKTDPVRYLVSPVGSDVELDDENEIRMVKVVLRSCGDKKKDVLRVKRVHGMLRASPGKDKFALLMFEGGNRFLLEFPNETTGVQPKLLSELIALVGEGNVTVEKIILQ